MEYGDVVDRLAHFTPEQAALFGAGCVYRVRPIVDACATPATAARFARILETLWQTGNPAEKQELLKILQNSSELSAGSAEEMRYWAHHALAMLFEAAQGEDPEEFSARAEACSALARNISADFDAVLTEDEGGPEIVLPPEGPHERLESTAQGEVMEILASGNGREDWIERIKTASDASVTSFTEDLPRFLRLAGWA